MGSIYLQIGEVQKMNKNHMAKHIYELVLFLFTQAAAMLKYMIHKFFRVFVLFM
jgi:hypothetical protein